MNKTYSDWQGSGLDLSKFFQVGDTVDEALYWYLLEVVPPASFGSNHVQCGEPSDHRGEGGCARYTTVARAGAHSPWIYLGERVRGDLTLPSGPLTVAGVHAHLNAVDVKPCPYCGRDGRVCWVMPCLELSFDVDDGPKRVNVWLGHVGAPFRVAEK